MGTRMQDEADRILNAVDDGAAAVIITFYDKGHLPVKSGDRLSDIRYYFEEAELNKEIIDYWMNYLAP